MYNTIYFRIALFFVFLGIYSASYYYGALFDVPEDEAREFFDEFLASLEEEGDAIGLFLNNVSIALAMFVPAAGVGWGIYSAMSTGYSFAAIVIANPTNLELASMNPMSIFFETSFGTMEIVAYSIAMSRSTVLFLQLIKKSISKKQIIYLGIEVGIVIALLVTGGIIEGEVIEENLSG